MSGIRIVVALGLALAGAARAAGASGPDFVDLYQAATQAYESKDYATMESRLREALALRPAHPTALYRLAAAQALRGTKDESFDSLRALAVMGLSYEPDKDADFESLRDLSGYKSLIATFERNRKPVGNPITVFRINEATFIPEGITYDGDTASYYISGAHERYIVRILRGIDDVTFVLPGVGGLLAPLGIEADSRRRLLWVAHAGLPQMHDPDPEDIGRSGINAYDLDTGRVRRRAMLPDDGRKHLLGDLELGRDGMLYVTDSVGGMLYRFDTTSGEFSPLVPADALATPQGVAVSEDRKTLYVSDYTQGIYAFDFESGELSRLEVGEGICVYGVDSLSVHGNNLVAVQNGVHPHRVILFRLDQSGRRIDSARVLAANLPEFDEPSLGVVVGNRFSFIANSQWGRFDENHRLPPRDQLRNPVVLRLTLPDA